MIAGAPLPERPKSRTFRVLSAGISKATSWTTNSVKKFADHNLLYLLDRVLMIGFFNV